MVRMITISLCTYNLIEEILHISNSVLTNPESRVKHLVHHIDYSNIPHLHSRWVQYLKKCILLNMFVLAEVRDTIFWMFISHLLISKFKSLLPCDILETFILSFSLDAIATAEYYKWFMYGPVLVPIGTLGIIGNILSIIVFTRPSMKNSALNCILIGKHIPLWSSSWQKFRK